MSGALTQDVVGGQHIKVHLRLGREALEREAEGAGVPDSGFLDLEAHGKPSLLLTCFQLSSDFLDELRSAIELLLKACEGAEEDHEVGV